MNRHFIYGLIVVSGSYKVGIINPSAQSDNSFLLKGKKRPGGYATDKIQSFEEDIIPFTGTTMSLNHAKLPTSNNSKKTKEKKSFQSSKEMKMRNVHTNKTKNLLKQQKGYSKDRRRIYKK